MRSKKSIFSNVDWFLIVLYLLMVFAGWMNIYAATFNEENSSLLAISQPYGKQLLWIIASLVLASLVFLLDFQFFRSFAYTIYWICILLLVGVLVVGTEIKGAKSWFVFGGIISLQPSEFAKYGTALALSVYLSDATKKFIGFKRRAKALVLIVLPAILILLQPDTGSTLVYTAFVFVLYREGLSGNILLLGVFAAVLFILAMLLNNTFLNLPFDITVPGKLVLTFSLLIISLLIYAVLKRTKNVWIPILLGFILSASYVYSVDYVFDNVLSTHQQDRINELLGIKSDPKGAGYNVHQSKIAIGSGGVIGKGFLNGTQTKFDFVPEQSTDFIFCTVGEEWGFIGSFILIVLFLLLLIRIILIAERQRSKFVRVYGYSVASIFFIHFSINIAMTIGLAPVIGIPLPFFSYGGSSLWGFALLLFTLIKLDSERKYVLR